MRIQLFSAQPPSIPGYPQLQGGAPVRAIGSSWCYSTARALASRQAADPIMTRGRLRARNLRFCGLTQQPKLVASFGIHALRPRATIT